MPLTPEAIVGSSSVPSGRPAESTHADTGPAIPLARPNDPSTQIKLWADEAIWGHRLYDEQVPWLAMLECLGVAFAQERAGRLFEESADHSLTYRPSVQLRLRNILFNSPRIALIAENGDDESCWREWLADMRQDSGGLQDDAADYGYLRKHFRSFKDFAAVVDFVRSSTIEGANNKRWSSQFLFPFGPSAVYEDVSTTKTGYSLDQRFFQRTGELLYLMLARSGRGPELSTRLRERFLDAHLPFSRLISVLQGDHQLCDADKKGAYLPFAEREEYSRLGRDWSALFDRALPGYDVMPHLVTMSGLNLLLYFLQRAQETVRESARPLLVLEIVSARRTAVRDLSADSYTHNNELPHRAVTAHIAEVEGSTEWDAAIKSPDAMLRTKQLFQDRFLWTPDQEGDDASARTPAELLVALQKAALIRHRQHTAKIHRTWGRAIGLASRRLSRRTRYAPTDALLKTLVICCVPNRMEFNEFVQLLFDRYGFVIGDRQAGAVPLTAGADREIFADNLERLEERLAGLGLVRRLSDQCAYIENPFAKVSA